MITMLLSLAWHLLLASPDPMPSHETPRALAPTSVNRVLGVRFPQPKLGNRLKPRGCPPTDEAGIRRRARSMRCAGFEVWPGDNVRRIQENWSALGAAGHPPPRHARVACLGLWKLKVVGQMLSTMSSSWHAQMRSRSQKWRMSRGATAHPCHASTPRSGTPSKAVQPGRKKRRTTRGAVATVDDDDGPSALRPLASAVQVQSSMAVLE